MSAYWEAGHDCQRLRYSENQAERQDGMLEDEGLESQKLKEAGLADEVGFVISRAKSQVLKLVDGSLQSSGLTKHHYAVLSLACANEAPTQREVATFMRLDPSRLVKILDELEDLNFVQRLPAPNDRRTWFVQATGAGRIKRASTAQALQNLNDQLLGDLTPSERSSFMENLIRLANIH